MPSLDVESRRSFLLSADHCYRLRRCSIEPGYAILVTLLEVSGGEFARTYRKTG